MNKLNFFLFLIFFVLGLSLFSISVNAASIGVSPPKIFLENESVNQTLWIINSNNASFDFVVSSTNEFLSFFPSEGKLSKNSKKSISVVVNKKQGFDSKIYEDIILISVYKPGRKIKSSIGVKARLNITNQINPIEFYFANESLNDGLTDTSLNNSINHEEHNLITGMSLFFNTKLKNNAFINVILVGLLIFLLSLFVKEPSQNKKKIKN
ncbi:hypothetical protein HN695_04610 [Candidatus Woesearchaeota archaeon]|jgi:hypothetical protein|nr:hypothetical protein [Candidatus Woesearchaeota archaeon]MBT5271858.1 hypothetical protein [Candidatus Woesearchaeota archaeon]MBT6041678.1 hypothetical protein [Candidatus Woesearchaeota archaeon]MBT6337346.1 hypothetical protein [Candidatus Woesearchaeota archaeon]MBT7927594.1 hypothetical protein [Candidatus Woesearchaeota archaeon]